MVSHVPTVDAAEIRRIVEELSTPGNPLPLPERVEVTDAEDHDGEPVWRMTLVFPASMPAETIPWKRISPLAGRFWSLVFEKGGEERFVLTKIKRLAEEPPEEP